MDIFDPNNPQLQPGGEAAADMPVRKPYRLDESVVEAAGRKYVRGVLEQEPTPREVEAFIQSYRLLETRLLSKESR